MDLNRILLIGNLTRDPETRAIPSGSQVTKFDIAVNDRRGGKEKETPMFIRVEAWNKTGELVAQYMKKGSMVLVEGRLKIEEYESKDGQKRRDPVVVADRVSFGPKAGGRDGGSEGGGDYAPRERTTDGGSSYGGSRESSSPRQSSGDEGGSHGGGAEDDLPF